MGAPESYAATPPAPSPKMNTGPALAALGALLDHSLLRIAAAAADARSFDRGTIATVADVWDNNTFPLFRAATAATARGRERRALAALRWMAGLGAERRAWMVEQAASAGYAVDGLLLPAREQSVHRNYRGNVLAPQVPMTVQAVAALAADYALASAELVSFSVERAGRTLVGSLHLALARTYGGGVHEAPARLSIGLEDITEVGIDSADAKGVDLRPGPDGITIGIGSAGTLRVATAVIQPDDPLWYRSAAGRRADAVTPPSGAEPRPAGPPRRTHLGPAAGLAARLLHLAMLEIRSVRHSGRADRVPVRDLCRAFAGAGEAVLAAGAHTLPHRREAAFLRLAETWIRRGGPGLAAWFAGQPATPGPRVPDPVRALTASIPSPATPPAPGPPGEAELRMAAYTAGQTRYGVPRAATCVVHLAVPPAPEAPEGGPWNLLALKIAHPARLRLRTGAFQGSNCPRLAGPQGDVRGLDLGGGALVVTGGTGTAGGAGGASWEGAV